MKTAFLLIGTLFVLVCGGRVLAQSSTSAEDRPDCYHEEFGALDFLAGEWDVRGSIRTPDGEWDDVSGRSVISQDLEGCVLIERYQDSRSGGGFSAIAVYSYDPIDGRLQKTWVDSGHGLAMLFRGGLVGEKLIFSSSKEIRGTAHYYVEQYSTPDAGYVVHERRRSADDRRTWIATSRMEYRRR